LKNSCKTALRPLWATGANDGTSNWSAARSPSITTKPAEKSALRASGYWRPTRHCRPNRWPSGTRSSSKWSRFFWDTKSLLGTRPIFHRLDETLRGHVFCSFLALVLKKELDRRLEAAGHGFEWADIKQDLKALQQITIEEGGKRFAIRTECRGTCGKVFQAVGVAVPPTIRQLEGT